MKNKKLKLEIESELIFNPKRRNNHMHMSLRDTEVTISEHATGKKLGHVTSSVGGGIDIHDDRTGEIWTISSKELWMAYQRALDNKK